MEPRPGLAWLRRPVSACRSRRPARARSLSQPLSAALSAARRL